MPVTTIDGHSIHNGAPGPATLRLREIYLDHARKGGVLG
jgi:D-alanine transaminase